MCLCGNNSWWVSSTCSRQIFTFPHKEYSKYIICVQQCKQIVNNNQDNPKKKLCWRIYLQRPKKNLFNRGGDFHHKSFFIPAWPSVYRQWLSKQTVSRGIKMGRRNARDKYLKNIYETIFVAICKCLTICEPFNLQKNVFKYYFACTFVWVEKGEATSRESPQKWQRNLVLNHWIRFLCIHKNMATTL